MPQSDFWPFTKNKVQDESEVKIQEESLLQKQLGDMEGEVKEIQMELAALRRNRMDLSQKQNLFPDAEEILKEFPLITQTSTNLNADKLGRFSEIAKLREDLMWAKKAANDERHQREIYESKLKDLEKKLNNICCSGNMTEVKGGFQRFSREEVGALKTQIRDMKEEIDELKITISEKNDQLQEYRIKYLQAQQQVEELKRQVDVIDVDNKQVSDDIQLEIQKMKIQFQEKLQELAPLPDLLKGAQIQLHEAKQLQHLAEESSQQLSNELNKAKEKLVLAVSNLNQEKHEKAKIIEENTLMKSCLDEKEKEIAELNKNIDDLKSQMVRLEEKLSQEETHYKEKANECSQLIQELDDLRTESNRTNGRYKERSESLRRYLQMQISALEHQLIQSRAQCRAFQKERDEIRQRMQIQINNLQKNFELIEFRLRRLQNQVTSLKKRYAAILIDNEDNGELDNIAVT